MGKLKDIVAKALADAQPEMNAAVAKSLGTSAPKPAGKVGGSLSAVGADQERVAELGMIAKSLRGGSLRAVDLADLNVRGGYKFQDAGKIIALYHVFGAAADGTKGKKDGTDVKAGDAYGSEFDIAYSSKIPGATGLTGLLKGAMYMGDDTTIKGASDKTMVWAQLDYKFSI